MSIKLLLHPAVDDARFAQICRAAPSVDAVNASSDGCALAEIVTADAFFGKITPELLARATRLSWVQAPTASLEHYLFPELVRHSCELTNMRGLFSDCIADHVLGFMICLARNFHRYFQRQQARRWEPVGGESARTDFVTGPGVATPIDRAHLHLADCTVGIVGVGAIGSEVARRARALGMSVVGVDPVVRSVKGAISEVWQLESLPRLLGESDFVVIAAPHTPETYKLFRQPQFELMRPGAYLINVGRGVIVDLEDLTAALENGVIAGAGLDVFEIEPLPADHRLWQLDNVIITPHIAGTSPRIAERHLETFLENLRRFVAGQPLATVVDKQRWY